MAVGEPPEQAGDDLRADALERADSETARVASLERGHVRFRGEKPRLDRVRVAQQDLPRLGEGDRSRPSRAFDETEPDDALQGGDLLGDGRLRVAQPLGGAPERALVGDRLERDEMPEVEPEPTIRFHDRKVAAEQEG